MALCQDPLLSNPNDVSPAASNLFFGVPFFEGGAWGSGP